MDLQTQVLSALALYGVPAVFGILVCSSTGLPLPGSFLLIVAGSFVAQGEMDFWALIAAGIGGAVIGDHIGYGLGRVGGRGVLDWSARLLASEARTQQAENAMRRWGGVSVFLTRWLLSPVGPWINLISGITGYSLPHFSFWDVAGETVWVFLYVWLGMIFSYQLDTLNSMLGDLTWVALGIVVVIGLGWKLVQMYRE
ncbi:MAG: DedA family protein [Caldilineaceae bacterium]